jgi:hypothetical protein
MPRMIQETTLQILLVSSETTTSSDGFSGTIDVGVIALEDREHVQPREREDEEYDDLKTDSKEMSAASAVCNAAGSSDALCVSRESREAVCMVHRAGIRLPRALRAAAVRV